MRTIFVDPDTFKCYTDNPESSNDVLIPVETDFFDGKCDAFVEGYRFVPNGYSWKREDGSLFIGEMIAPWKDYAELDEAQREYERQRVSELKTENETLLADMAQLVEEVYQSDVEMMGI